MNRLVYKWDLDNFVKCFNEMGLKSSFKRVKGRNAILVKVADFEEMKCLFGYGRSMWAIAIEESYWKKYVEDYNRVQFVYLNFDVKETMESSGFAFTYDPIKYKFTDAATRCNKEMNNGNNIEYILANILDCPIELIRNMNAKK